MHFCFYKSGERQQSAQVRGEEVQGSRCPYCWLEEETDPGEALACFAFSFLPLTNPYWEAPRVSLNATSRAASSSGYLSRPQARAGRESWAPPWSPSCPPACPPFPNSIRLSLSSTQTLPSLLFLSFFLSSLLCSSNLPQKENHFKGGWCLFSFLHLCCCHF